MKVKDIFLPQHEGCQYIHITIENDDLTEEVKYYHMTNFQEPSDGNDYIFEELKKEINSKNLDTRDKIKNSLKNFEIPKKD